MTILKDTFTYLTCSC